LNELLTIFLNNLLPVFLMAGAGYALARYKQVDYRILSSVVFYILSPCLVFTALTQNTLSYGEMFNIFAFAASSILLAGVIAWIASKVLHFDKKTTSAVLLGCMFMNVANFGFPVVLFAFGEAGLSYATLLYIANVILLYSVGVVIASMGTSSLRQSLINLLKVPSLYGLVFALIFIWLGWKVPLPLQRTTSLLGNASIPILLVMLGMQFKEIKWSIEVLPVAVTSVIRLVLIPLLALVLIRIFNIHGIAYQVSILEVAMPTAVLTTVLATEYGAEPSLTTATVFITTLLSPITLTPLLAYLGA
jgi:predicted permease